MLVRARLHGQHRESLADIFGLAPDAGDGEDRLTGLAKQPLVLALLFASAGVVNSVM
jgi:hypothetical protein